MVGLCAHADVFKAGVESDVIVSNHVLNMYAKCGKLGCARKVFDKMPERNIVSWSAMISGYEQGGECLMALELFCKLPLVPTEYVFASAISACADVGMVMCGRQLHGQSLKFGRACFSFVSNSLISMYMRFGWHDDAFLVYSDASECNLVTYNALIKGFAENQQPIVALDLFKHLCRQGLVPDQFSFMGVLCICKDSEFLNLGISLHSLTVKLSLESVSSVGNVIIMMYSGFKMIAEALKAFYSIIQKDIISWNSIIAACSHCEDHIRALWIFTEMISEKIFSPDNYTFASVLGACAMVALIRRGKEVHAHLIRTTHCPDLIVLNALVNMYAKCGCINQALSIFNRMTDRNLITWNTMIAGLANHGYGEKALNLFEEMKDSGVKPDALTFMGVLIACNHAGLVKEGQDYFNCMENSYAMAPDLEHFSCLIDLLGRAGNFSDAEKYMSKFPFGDDPVILGSLLSASLLHKNVEFGLGIATKLLKLGPTTTSPYVLLSKCFALCGMWDSVAEVRKMMKNSGLKKEPGHSLIEVNGIVERFTMGEFVHSRSDEIGDMLEFLSGDVMDVA
ncbi:hypothetical protein QQ045_013171 [Rhodiola kirilowii]